MKKKILSIFLALLMAFPSSTVIAAVGSGEDASSDTTDRQMGDINADGIVNVADALELFRYTMIPDWYPIDYSGILDFDSNGLIDLNDAVHLFRYSMMPDWYPLPYSVSFYDGDRLIDTLTAERDQALGAVPSVEKSSKPNAILLGYFIDPEFTRPFYAENPVTADMNVYAKYEEMGPQETLNFTSFAQMDQSADLSFEISGIGNPADAVTLEVMDGSDPVELAFTSTDSGYIVYAPAGFNEGCSYQLHLADGWTFTGKADTIRTASFSIHMEEVENIRMNDDIVYIMDTDAINYTVNGQIYDVLTSGVISENGGFFSYESAEGLMEDDILCIYVDKHPELRNNGSDTLLPVVYVKVSYVDGDTVVFEQLSAEDQQRLYDIPDNFPIPVDALPVGTIGMVNINDLDAAMYATMMGEGYDLDKAKESVATGDFITLYVSVDSITSEDDLYYAEITGYDAMSGVITYKQVTKQTILDSMDLYANSDVKGSDYITDEEKAEMEKVLLAQVEDSGFAEDAAFMLADMITKTDAFRSTKGIRNFIITDAEGNELSADEIELLNLGASFELSDGVKLTVELVTEGDQLRYDSGVQVAIGVDAEFEVELNDDDDKIAINLSATFVQEVALSPRVNGNIVYKEILWIPIPVGVKVGATIDIRSFTAFSFEAEIFTVAAEDESLWEQFKDVANNPEKLADLSFLPEELSAGLKTAGDLFDKIEELQDNVKKAQDKAEQYQGYLEDIEMLWNVIEENGLTTREDYEAMCEALDKTSITSDLLEMMNMTNETGLETEYYESLEALMERYSEMLEKESDWVKLVECEIFKMEQCFYGIAIGTEVNFVVRADLSLAIGSNLQYEVGKRYEFWFKIGLFKPSAGSSTMDLLDEHFAFQFYVMGRLGLRAGINAQVYVGLGTGDFAKVGIYTELGPYIKIYGFFIYEYEKFRAANTSTWVSDERMAGAIFMEFGLYFILGFEASALGDLFSYSYDFLDVEIPLLTIGEDKFYYGPDYEPAEDEVVLVKDVDNNSSTGITMTLPQYMLGLKYVHMTEGYMGIEYKDYSNFIYTVSNPNFTIDPATGEISVTVPETTRYMECDLTITYKFGKLAFSTYDMSVTVPLVWTNLATAELNEYYTAAVRVGNDNDGFDTVWSKRVLKNKEFDLPTAEEIMEMIDWNEYKYDMGGGYGSQQLEKLTLIEDEVYDFNIDYDTYSITVSGVQNSDGTVTDRTYHAEFGKSFDFSDLAETGTTDYVNGVFTKFSTLTAPEGFNITKAIDTRMAEMLKNGITLTANYADNTVTATFEFNGIDAESVEVKLRRGDVPSIAEIEAVASEYGMGIEEIFPAVGVLNGSTTYQVVCGELKTASATITFEENGGYPVNDITKPYGSLIGVLPTPEKPGNTFGGWYVDEELTKIFDLNKMPEGGATVYAKWTANEYTVVFHVNGGNALESEEISKTVPYGFLYGTLPTPERTGYGFIGWFTAVAGGEQITEDTVYILTQNQILYAQWRVLKDIPRSIFDFGEIETFVYEEDTGRAAEFVFTAEEGEIYSVEEFTFEYIAEGYEAEGYFENPTDAGVWGVKVTRPADEHYSKFEAFFASVIKIEKGERGTVNISICSGKNMNQTLKLANGLTYLNLNVVPFEWNWENPSADALNYIDNSLLPMSIDASDEIKVILHAYAKGTDFESLSSTTPIASSVPTDLFDDIRIFGLMPGTSYEIYGTFTNDRNYNDSMFRAVYPLTYFIGDNAVTMVAPGGSTKWTTDNENYPTYDISWYNTTDTEFVIDTPAELAGVAKLVNAGTESFAKKTIKLGADVNMSELEWVPIGTSSHPFHGTFDGQGYTISGLYFNRSSQENMGLFGYATYTIGYINSQLPYIDAVPVIKNVVVDDSLFYGKSRVGGIVGYIGGGEILNCTNYAIVMADQRGFSDSYESCAGGIVGLAYDTSVSNCVNYGRIYSEGRLTGGIIGLINGATICLNNANFGSVVGSSRVGGVAGCVDGDDGIVYNCYNYGTVRPNDGSNDYIGGIVGRNVDDNGVVQYSYYLKDCAKGGNGKSRSGLGKDGGSVTDGNKNYFVASFTSTESLLGDSAKEYAQNPLINALNAFVNDPEWADLKDTMAEWDATGPNGYPLPIGIYSSALRK